jgi:hypothetical protein
VKTSWERILDFDLTQAAYRDRHNNEQSRFTYALDRVVSQLPKIQKRVQARMSEFEIDLCETKEPEGKGPIVRDAEGRLQFTKDNLKKVNAQKEEWVEAFNVKIDPYFATSLPEGLSYFELMAFSEFVIKSEDSARLLIELESKYTAAEKPAEPAKEIANVRDQNEGQS